MNEVSKDEAVASEHLEFSEDAREQPKLDGHQWRQRGVVVYCASCPFEHSFLVGPEVSLVGLDEHGFPKFISHE